MQTMVALSIAAVTPFSAITAVAQMLLYMIYEVEEDASQERFV